MPSIHCFGRYLPDRVVTNAELAQALGRDAEWIRQASGIEERRVAAPDQNITDLAIAAGRDCLQRSGEARIGLTIVASGSAERRFPGPAAAVSHALGFAGAPALDLPYASTGGLFGMAVAAQLAPVYGSVLVIAAEKMFQPAGTAPAETAILFGDGAGACLINPADTGLRIIDSALHSDGANTANLFMDLTGPVNMNGLAVIRNAARRLPEVIQELLNKHSIAPDAVAAFLTHQANQNLIDRVARGVGVTPDRFYSNIQRYGNTSSASILIAASEWSETARLQAGDTICFAAFGAGFHWGAVLARATG
jgi:3-oxoacyl-[acyl-carrier-protein] synthase III